MSLQILYFTEDVEMQHFLHLGELFHLFVSNKTFQNFHHCFSVFKTQLDLKGRPSSTLSFFFSNSSCRTTDVTVMKLKYSVNFVCRICISSWFMWNLDPKQNIYFQIIVFFFLPWKIQISLAFRSAAAVTHTGKFNQIEYIFNVSTVCFYYG